MITIYNQNALCHKIYLAGPFFTEEQKKTMEIVELLAHMAELDYFSPRLRCLCPPEATPEQRAYTFNMNVNAIDLCDLVLACIDDFDPGTMWELGYAFHAKRPVYAYSMVPGRGLNLMLAQSCKGFLNGAGQLADFMPTNNKYVNFEAATPVHKGNII